MARLGMRSVEGIIASEPFTFVVGPSRSKYFINIGLIESQSKVLGALCKGQLQEATSKEAILDDTAEDTFVRFIQYAMVGSYDLPITPRIVDLASGYRASDDEEYESALFEEMSKSEFLVDEQTALLKPFESLAFGRPAINNTLGEIKANTDEREELTDVFLCHAKLYVFGDKYDVQGLKLLALHNLHRTLLHFTIFPARVGDLMALILFTYEHTPERNAEPLRMMLTNFCAWNIKRLSSDSGFMDFYDKGGSFARDVLENLVKRLSAEDFSVQNTKHNSGSLGSCITPLNKRGHAVRRPL